MFNIFKELLKKGERVSGSEKGHSPEKELQVATCALLLEMASMPLLQTSINLSLPSLPQVLILEEN